MKNEELRSKNYEIHLLVISVVHSSACGYHCHSIDCGSDRIGLLYRQWSCGGILSRTMVVVGDDKDFPSNSDCRGA